MKRIKSCHAIGIALVAAIGLTVAAISCSAQAPGLSESPAVSHSKVPIKAEDYAEAELSQTEEESSEASLIERGYYRKDIPLSFIEQDFLHSAADEFGIDYYIMVALIDRETRFQNIYGDGGNAYGYCQIWPKWWAGLMEKIGAEDLNDPQDNFRTAAAILAQNSERFGDIESALTAYNTGKPGTSEYATCVIANAEKWRNGTP